MEDCSVVDFVDLLPAEGVDLLEVVELFAVEYLLFSVVATEYDIEDKPDDRQQGDDDDPRKSLDRIAFVVYDYGDRNHDEEDVSDTQQRFQVGCSE